MQAGNDIDAPPWLSEGPDGCIVTVHVQPGARGVGVVGQHGDALKIRIDAPPIDGRANQALLSFLAERLGIAKSRLSVLSGESSRRKRVLVRDMSRSTLVAHLRAKTD